MYCVISGHKDFILVPPVDMHYVPRSKYPSGIYRTNADGAIQIEPVLDGIIHFDYLSSMALLIIFASHHIYLIVVCFFSDDGNPTIIEWVSIDPLRANIEKFPNYAKASTFHVRVHAGDILYLPSLWYHHVRQSHKCIAVNFWYDMDYDARYCYYKMMETLCGYRTCWLSRSNKNRKHINNNISFIEFVFLTFIQKYSYSNVPIETK